MMGRALQGLGCAAPRIVMMAIVRDQYSGDAMARIMSFVMSVFILVPAIAPAIGQGLMLVFDWRAIFVMLLAVRIIAALWLGIRQPETHPPEKRRPFRLAPLWVAFREVIRHRVTVGYTVAAGFIFAPFIGFLSSCQQVFAGVYGQGDNFPYLFGILALAIGSASAVNGKLVLRWGMGVYQQSTQCRDGSGLSFCRLCAAQQLPARSSHVHGLLPHRVLLQWNAVQQFKCHRDGTAR